jgi:hypothetical protein
MKYCPLCYSEYRDTAAVCSECNLSLVDTLDSPEVRENPPRLLWTGRYSGEFDRVASALRETRIPAHAVERGALGRAFKFISTIHVLSTDFERALTAAEEAFEAGRKTFGPVQVCHACTAVCSDALTACPKCHAVLRVEQEKDQRVKARDGTSEPILSPSERRYCPACDSEYSSLHEKCTVCGVDLVPEEKRGLPRSEKEKHDALEIVWRGGDPVALSRVVAALEENGLRHHVQSACDHLVFELAMPRPKYNVRVFKSDAGAARELLGSIQDSPFFGAQVPPESSAPEPGDGASASMPKWNPAAATKEIWSSDDSALTRLIEECLDENRIGVRRQGIEPGAVRLLVQPELEARAREIIREIVESSPRPE